VTLRHYSQLSTPSVMACDRTGGVPDAASASGIARRCYCALPEVKLWPSAEIVTR
jgi:hypothetical protein